MFLSEAELNLYEESKYPIVWTVHAKLASVSERL
jgi:hypothetical protein